MRKRDSRSIGTVWRRAAVGSPGRAVLPGLARVSVFALMTAGSVCLWVWSRPLFGLGSPQAGSNLIAEGQKIFDSQPCLGCHTVDGRGGSVGPNLTDEGAKGRSLAWLKAQISDPQSHDPNTVMPAFKSLNSHQMDALAAYLDSLKGKPTQAPSAPAAEPGAGGDLPLGGELFRLNCAPCHQMTARGGGLVGTRANAPSLAETDPAAIPAFIRSGPGPMPAFNEYVFSGKEVASLVLYIEALQKPVHPGGFGLFYLGTVPEGLVAFVFGLGLAVLAAVLIEWKGRG
jgi:ubiquinol-cytochrome c reductase cytochrome c subunit